jgi:para-nitrobenzyl esterase
VERLEARIVEAWSGFARSGAPGASGLPDWPPYTLERRETMTLGATCALELDPGSATRRLWAGFPARAAS